MQTQEPTRVTVRNVGGIGSAEVELSPGVTVLEGRNATNRTSFLQAVSAALGSDRATLKGDAEEGEVRLRVGGEEYTRTFRREGGTVVTGGDPYLDDPQVADLFAFLFEANEARRAVVAGEDLRELIMRPVDTDELQAEIDRLKAERDRIDDELADLDSLADRLPELERRRSELREAIEDQQETLAAAREAVDDADGVDAEDRRQRRERLDGKLDDLNERRSDLEAVEFRIETEEESLESLREEREEIVADLESVPTVPEGDLEAVEAELDRLRERRRSVESTVGRLDGIVEFNREMLSGDRPDALDRLGGGDRNVVDELLSEGDRTVTCWTCGSVVERSAIDATQDKLRDLRAELREERDGIREEIRAKKERAEELRQRRERRSELRDRLDRVEAEVDEREATLSELRARREDVADAVEDLEATVSELRSATDDDELVERQREVSEAEFELGRLEDDLDEVISEIAGIEERLDAREDFEDRRESVETDLVDCRRRVEAVEREAVEAFNDRMDELLALLDYDNVERVWIERTEVQGRHGRTTESARAFDLHVVRSADDGTAYEDSVDTLSESEREVVGLVFALAGHLAHDVGGTVPFVLLDSLEAIDADRIATLVDYFADEAEFLVVALLPEDAAAVAADDRITEI